VEAHCGAWPPGALHVERFSPKEVGEPVRSDAFEVELAQSGLTLTVPPDRSILDVVEEAGVPVLSSCQEGTCGTCETPVLEGEVDHRDSLLTAEEQQANDTMFICVSRAACPKLVLDL
jgi:ferredoxin